MLKQMLNGLNLEKIYQQNEIQEYQLNKNLILIIKVLNIS
jgi:hypothetical protein